MGHHGKVTCPPALPDPAPSGAATVPAPGSAALLQPLPTPVRTCLPAGTPDRGVHSRLGGFLWAPHLQIGPQTLRAPRKPEPRSAEGRMDGEDVGQ